MTLVKPKLRIVPGGNLYNYEHPRDSQINRSEIIVIL
jgi:hypothetical protein